MKIFLPFQQDLNPYLEEIIKFSRHTYIYGDPGAFDSTFSIVNIHWPEAIFDWKEPSLEQLKDLQKEVKKWKENSHLVYTKHDLERHKGMTPNFKKLFDLIETHADVFIHLGEYSRKLYQTRFPQARHEIVYHPLYLNSFDIIPKLEARERLGIAPDAKVIIAPGQIRSDRERDLIIEGFKELKHENLVLIVPNMRAESLIEFPGRVRLKKIFDIRRYFVNRFKRKYLPPKFIFTYQKLSAEELSTRMAAADLVFIPRRDILNSGNLFLGLSFNKVVVGPEIGNMKEQLNTLGMPVFNPDSLTSVGRALEEGIEMSRKGHEYTEEQLAPYHPQKVAQRIDGIFEEMVKKNEFKGFHSHRML